MHDYDDLTRRLADLVVGFGANVQPGQLVGVTSYLGKEALTREIARGGDHPGGLVQEHVRERLTLDALTVHLDDVPLPHDRVELSWFAVDPYAAVTDETVSPPP